MRNALLILATLLPLEASAAGRGVAEPLLQHLRAGRYEEVLRAHERLRDKVLPPRELDEATAALGRALCLSGRLAEGEAALGAFTSKRPDAAESRLALGLCLRAAGKRDRERAVWERFFDEHDAGALDQKSPAAMRRLGVAARYLGSYKDANDTFREAARLAREQKNRHEIVRINIEWAALFLEKYAAGYAEVSLEEALAQDAEDPDARALYARVKLEQGNDVAGAEEEISRALKVHGRHPEALAIRAEIFIDNEQYDEALRTTAILLAQNPSDLRARSLKAAAHLLREERQLYEEEKARVLEQHPGYTELHRIIAELLTTQHRYEDALALLMEAVKIDPRDYYALSQLGSAHLRLGQDEPGLQALRAAWKGDRFNVRTFNLLELFEKVIPKRYDMLTVDIDEKRPGKGGLRIRLPAAERKLLLPLLVPLIQREFSELVRRYRFTPALPITLELYADPQHYAVRTVGLPGLAALGVTFGRVVTGRSPAQAAFNWGLMIWHELSHVFAIQLSRSRVPRWFTEGLSEWETAQARPEWTRRTHAELAAAIRDGKLLPLSELNAGFTRARDVAHIVVAYHEAAAAMEFLVRRFGFERIVEALRLFGEGARTSDVLRRITSMDGKQLDEAFAADLRARLDAYEGTFFVRPSDYSDAEALKAALKARPNDARLHGLMAISLARGGERAQAQKAAEQALKLDGRCREGLLAMGEILLKDKDLAGAAARFQELIAANGDGYDVRLRLGEIAVMKDDLQAAERELARAKKMDPDRAEPYQELARLYTKLRREDDALAELMEAARLEIMDAELVRGLVKRLHARRRFADVVRFGEMARFIDPYHPDLRAHIGEALLGLGRRAEARQEIDAALEALGSPEDEEEAARTRKRRAELEALRQRAR